MLRIGRHAVASVTDGRFRLDGGAMFGVVPKTLWEREAVADASNRVLLGLNCLLIECPDGERVLVDTGLGDRWSDEERERLGRDQPAALLRSLAQRGVRPRDVNVVVLTHLHFDHAGGAVTLDDDGALVPTFPEARHVVQRTELEEARTPHVRHRASYRPDDFEPLADAGLLDLVDGEHEVAPGIVVQHVGGHCPGLQVVRLEAERDDAVEAAPAGLVFLSDLCPTRAHVRPAWTMGFDLDACRIVDEKVALLERAARDGWLVALDHDAEAPIVRLSEEKVSGKTVLRATPVHEGVTA